jgi:hypothetical protein
MCVCVCVCVCVCMCILMLLLVMHVARAMAQPCGIIAESKMRVRVDVVHTNAHRRSLRRSMQRCPHCDRLAAGEYCFVAMHEKMIRQRCRFSFWHQIAHRNEQ